jgi:hypothetical protein
VQIDERTELAPALGELAANFTALVQVLLGNGQQFHVGRGCRIVLYRR